MNLIKPAALRPGHKIGVVAAASNIKQDLLDQGCRELESLGFKTYYRPDITTSFRYFSGTRERRLGEFLEMLKSPDIHAIFCARGGYGSGQLIPDIDVDVLRQNAKIINGSSDITFLLNWSEGAGLVSFHGPMVATAIRQGTEGYDRQLLLDLLQGKQAVKFPTAATTHLKQAGKFDEVRGIVFGEMLNCIQNASQGYPLEEVLLDLLGEYNFPILYGFPTGHTSRPNVIVPFGVRACLDLTSKDPLFELLESAVV